MRIRYPFHHPFIWFENGGWWFKVFDECFGPYQNMIEARHNFLVIKGLSQQLREAVAG
ncbi:MAG: hypothetical protein LAE24_11250 [Candidatus Contendobacter sp.]|nr:hypothetical protein [Candidatus Contendobacter sp.]